MKNNGVKLNFLLVMPRLVQSIGDGYVFPLGVAYVSSSMKKAGFRVFTLNLNHRQGEVFEIIQKAVKEHGIDVVATGGLSPQYHLVKSVIESAKKADSRIVTIVGGGIISSDPETAIEALEFADFGVIGEGEATMCELASCLEAKGDFSKVDGLIYKEGQGYKKTNSRKDIEDISSIPWPDYEGFDVEQYLETPSAGFAGINKKRVICMLGSRSCPFNCTFCCHTIGKKFRRRSLDDFFAELDYLVSRYRIEYVSMADEVFAPDLASAKEFCGRIKKYSISWYADFRIDKVKPELLGLLKESGLEVMFFGIESADNRILKSMRKGITIEQIEKVLKMVYESGIASYGCFIFGDIAETLETAQNTLNWWKKHREYAVHLTLVKPFPGSYIYQYACQKGIIKDRIQYLKDGCPQVNISLMDDKEFAYIVRQISESLGLMDALGSVELLGLDPLMGRETISGTCAKCSQRNIWENIKLFSIDYIYCSHCGQKYEIPNPPQLRANLDRNISALLRKYGKVAIWGMTLSVMDLFKHSRILADPNVFPIDISESKRKTDFFGKIIYAPDILGAENIPVVVIAVPSHGGQISCQVKENHPGVTEIIDICQLVGFN
ncbi:MAG: radical SAM protein [Candidatus Omnitrophota bacterium]